MKNHKVIVDLSSVLHVGLHGVFRGEMEKCPESGKLFIPENKLRQALIGSIMYYKNIKGRPSQTIIAIDRGPYWRKNIFPHYKGLRSAARVESDIDWTKVYSSVDVIISEIDTYLPWTLIQIPSLEADDIIGCLAPKLANEDEVLIISSDKDLVQLQKYKNVSQYSPQTKVLVKPTTDPVTDLYIKVLKGDGGDGIANIFSDDDFYIRKNAGEKLRQPQVTSKLITEAKKANWDPYVFLKNDKDIAKFERNKLLVDFEQIPRNLKDQCWQNYVDQISKKHNAMRLQSYLVKNRLKHIHDSLNEI